MQVTWDWIKDKLLGPIIAAAVLAVLAFGVGLLGLPHRVERLESQTDKIPEIRETVGGLKADQKNFKDASDKLATNIKDFSDKLQTLSQSTGELKATVDNLKGLTTDIRELRQAMEDLRVTVVKLSYQDSSLEISAVVFLNEQNLKREGNVFVAQLQYPERLGGKAVRNVRPRLTVPPIPGVSSLSLFPEVQKTGYSLFLTAPIQEADAVAQFLKVQPIRVEVIYVVDR